MYEALDGAMSPSQQLGAVPGTPEGGVPGYEGIEPELDSADFASSGEAEGALRQDPDFDTELTEDVLAAARAANTYANLPEREL